MRRPTHAGLAWAFGGRSLLVVAAVVVMRARETVDAPVE